MHIQERDEMPRHAQVVAVLLVLEELVSLLDVGNGGSGIAVIVRYQIGELLLQQYKEQRVAL